LDSLNIICNQTGISEARIGKNKKTKVEVGLARKIKNLPKGPIMILKLAMIFKVSLKKDQIILKKPFPVISEERL
jgi:hypothetical protein